MLTKTKATSQAASRVRNLMPGALVTADTRGSWDLATDQHLFITTVTYPVGHIGAVDARAALMRMAGVTKVEMLSGCTMIVTRAAR